MATLLKSSRAHRSIGWLALLLVGAAGFAMVAIPVWLIMPFKPQYPRGLAVSFFLRSWSPWVTPLFAAIAIVLVVWLWLGRTRVWQKPLLILLLGPIALSTWFARKNHFEWMFAPLTHAQYASPDGIDFISDKDRVMAVENNGEAVAYPIRLMAYHHVVQDVVGGTPIVATY